MKPRKPMLMTTSEMFPSQSSEDEDPNYERLTDNERLTYSELTGRATTFVNKSTVQFNSVLIS